MSDRTITMAVDRAASVAPATFNRAARTVDLVFAAGATVRRAWYYEAIPVESIDLSRLNAGAALLDSHDARSVRGIIGSTVPGTARIENGVACVTVRLDTDEAGEIALGKIERGHLREVSFGCDIEAFETSENAEGDTIVTVTRCVAREVSLCAAGADPGARVRSAAGGRRTEEDTMSERVQPAGQTTDPAGGVTVDTDAIRTAAVVAERDRARQIRAAAKALDLGDLGQTLVDEGVSLDVARARILDAAAARAEAQPQTRGQIEPGTAAIDKIGPVVALALRARLGDKTLTDAEKTTAGDLRGCSLIEMLGRLGDAAGIRHAHLDAQSRAALLGRGERAMGTWTFPNILENSISKTLTEAPAEAADPWTQIGAVRRDLPDFKTASLVQLSGFPEMPAVPEGGVYHAVTASDKKEAWSLAKYGYKYGFTWESLINDDLNALTDWTAAIMASSAATDRALVWGLITTPQTMGEDGLSLWDASHANAVLAAGGPPNKARLDAMWLLIRKMKSFGASPRPLELRPRILLVPTSLRPGVDALLGPYYSPTTVADAIPGWARGITVLDSATLDAHSDKRWYMISTGIIPMYYGYLRGTNGLTVTRLPEGDVDGIEFKVRKTFGCRIPDFRAWYMNVGQ